MAIKLLSEDENKRLYYDLEFLLSTHTGHYDLVPNSLVARSLPTSFCSFVRVSHFTYYFEQSNRIIV